MVLTIGTPSAESVTSSTGWGPAPAVWPLFPRGFFDLQCASPACSPSIGPLLPACPLLAAPFLSGLALSVRAPGGRAAQPDCERTGEPRELALGLGGAAAGARWELIHGGVGLKGLPAGSAQEVVKRHRSEIK